MSLIALYTHIDTCTCNCQKWETWLDKSQ